MNFGLALAFIPLGLFCVVLGLYWISRLSEEESDAETAEGDRLISVGCGGYESEGMILFRAILCIVLGIICFAVGFFA